MLIRRAEPDDARAIASIIVPTFREGRTYAIDCNISETDALAYWTGPDRTTYVLEQDGNVIGTYYIRPNQGGGGSHVANCGYITSEAASGRGVATAMCLHSMEQARKSGYAAIQFNFVVSSNHRAIGLWQALGFEIAGRVPAGFRHPEAGFVDALIMHRFI